MTARETARGLERKREYNNFLRSEMERKVFLSNSQILILKKKQPNKQKCLRKLKIITIFYQGTKITI
jgi:hypothetical protein